ncbi:DUF986 family protein [Listeria sp. PSOL-1]|uniref:DUF986 family protein n=1 Tax=Listeria sp. PSOL-1 TaxID=1844999 RepID=UPI0013D0FC81|nr:DUF986 family protein [Listeria sp. PSOL-1]
MEWTITDLFLLILNIGALLFIIYDGLILTLWKGQTRLKVNLKSRNRSDSYIFVGLIALLLFSNIFRDGAFSTTILLAIMEILFLFICFIRQPKVIFKENGLFYRVIFYPYIQIERVNLSEDGILVLETGRQRLLLFAKNPDDLQKILTFLKDKKITKP